jgi:putative salt-induced outer membrane protein YdiY
MTSSISRFVLPIVLMALPALAARGEEEKKAWSGSVSLSGGHSSGTKTSFNGRLEAGVQRDWERDRARFNVDALYGKSDGEVNVNAQKVFGDYRHNFSPRFFGYWDAELGRDAVQEIKLRALTTLGPGYRIWEQDEKSYLDGEMGVGFLHESYLDGTSSRNSPELRAAYEYKDVVGPQQALELSHDTEVLMPLNDVEGVLLRSRVSLAVPLVLELKFKVSFDAEYQNQPAASAEKWNTRSTFGLLYEF